MEETSFEQPQTYYAVPGPMTDFRQHRAEIDPLPVEIGALVRAQQQLLVHIFWANRYGLELSEERQAEVQIRPVDRKVTRLLELDPHPLSEPRPLERRLVGNCRDFSTFLTGVLRARGIAARARCGFGTYFMPQHFEDHWVVEYWDAARAGWVMVDSQLDELQLRKLKISFDPLDLPPGQFISGGRAWLMARRGEADPEQFGIFDMHGIDFIRGNLLRDLASLNKLETLPWDMWGILDHSADDSTTLELALLDTVAELTLKGDAAFPALRTVYENTPGFQVPAEWTAG